MQNNKRHEKTILLLHGMWMNKFVMHIIGRGLVKKGWRVIYFDYSSMFSDFGQNTQRLYQLWQQYESESTHLVAHSLGGLIVLKMMRKFHLKNLPRTVFIGTPINGSAVAKKLLRSFMGRMMLGKSLFALINGEKNKNGNRIGLIAGSRGLGIGHLIQPLPKPHDGVVAVQEVSLDDAEDKIVLPLTHATLLASSQTVDAINDYLTTGRFKQ